MFTYALSDQADLKLLQLSDADELYAQVDRNRQYLREWMPWVDATRSSADTKAFIQSTLNQISKNDGFQACIRFEKKIVGTIGFHRVDWLRKTTSIGYWISSDMQGKGIVTRATKAVTNHAFQTWNVNRVEIHCAPKNTKSRAIPLRLQFKEEGIMREAEWLNDRFSDLVLYSMLSREWPQE